MSVGYVFIAYLYDFFSRKKENKTDWNSDNNKLKSSAIQNPDTLKPGTISLANNTIQALMTNRNKPKVMMVTGSVKITKIGFTISRNKPKTIATNIAAT